MRQPQPQPRQHQKAARHNPRVEIEEIRCGIGAWDQIKHQQIIADMKRHHADQGGGSGQINQGDAGKLAHFRAISYTQNGGGMQPRDTGSAVLDGNEIAAWLAHIQLTRTADFLVVFRNHLFPLRNPTHRARQRKNRCEHRRREPHRIQDYP